MVIGEYKLPEFSDDALEARTVNVLQGAGGPIKNYHANTVGYTLDGSY